MTAGNWAALNTHQLGRYAEYLVKMAFTRAALDVYTAEVDDKGIDFVLRVGSAHYVDVQVKSLRGPGYVFVQKSKFELRENLWLAFVMFPSEVGEPTLYLIPSTVWSSAEPPFVDRDYEGLKSKPEFGINVSKKGLARLADFRFDRMVGELRRDSHQATSHAGGRDLSDLFGDMLAWKRQGSCRRVGEVIEVSFPGEDSDDDLCVVIRGDVVCLMLPTIDWLGHWPILGFDPWKEMHVSEFQGRGARFWLDGLLRKHEGRKSSCQHCRRRFMPARMAGDSCHGCAERLDGVVF